MDPAIEGPNGLATYLKVIYAPKSAFEALNRYPTWGWAAAIAMIVLLVSAILMWPVSMHFMQVTQQQQLSHMSADQAAQTRQFDAMVPRSVYAVFGVFGSFFGTWFSWLMLTVAFVIGAAAVNAKVAFIKLWATSVNLWIISLIGGLIVLIVVPLRGPQSVNAIHDLFVIPSLGMVVHNPPWLAGLLYYYNITMLWLLVVAVIALERVVPMPRKAAIITMVVYSLVSAGIGTAFMH